MERIIFFDLDDTLYKRCRPFAEAAVSFFRYTGFQMPEDFPEQAFSATQKRCEEVFEAVQRGELSPEEGFVYRYTKGFEDVGVQLSRKEALLFRDAYQEAQKNIRLEPEAEAVLNSCRKRYRRIGLITNGQGPHQRKKIAALGLGKWLDEELAVISGEIGIDKPDPGIFEYAARKAGVQPERLVYVGDSAETDVIPAGKAGWNAVLWDWKDTEKSLGEIFRLSEDTRNEHQSEQSGSKADGLTF